MNHIWSVLCNKALVDQDTNNISLIDVVEKIDLAGPLEEIEEVTEGNKKAEMGVDFQLASFWFRTDDSKDKAFELKVVLENPDGKETGSIQKKVPFKAGINRMRTRIRIKDFNISGPGIYSIKVFKREEESDDYKKVASIPLEIILKEAK